MNALARRILIVEDQGLIAADLANRLEKLGYEVVANAAEGEEAVDKALALVPDLILMDIRLRGPMDGICAAETIRARIDIPIVYLTAYADEETIRRAKITTPFGYVVKPFNERELRASIEIAIYRHETERLLAEERGRRAAAEAAVRGRDEFLQIASHELKTPLAPLQLQLDAMRRALARAGVVDERIAAMLEIAICQTARLSRLVDSLLDMSLITGSRLELDVEPLDMAGIVRAVADRLRPEAANTGSEVVIHSDESIAGAWDRLRVEQIVANLLSNAIKYGRGKPIEIEVHAEGRNVELSVTDHGIGIECAALPRIFEQYERAVPVRHFGGLGLGLFIARHFAEAHGGRIMAHSEYGAGSTFTVMLPLAGDRAAAREPGTST